MFKASTVASNCPLYENWGRRGVCAVTPMVLIEKQLLSTDTCVKSRACLTHIFTVLKTCPLTLFILIEWNQRQFCSLNFTLWWSSTFFFYDGVILLFYFWLFSSSLLHLVFLSEIATKSNVLGCLPNMKVYILMYSILGCYRHGLATKWLSGILVQRQFEKLSWTRL